MTEGNGREALFGPVAPPLEGIPTAAEGRRALFSAKPRQKGTVVIECSRCEARSPVPVLELGPRLVPSVWIPGRSFSRLLRCPACGRFAWCKVHWRSVLG
jgi:hypothetical protein